MLRSTPGDHALHAIPRGTYLLCMLHFTPGAHALHAIPRGTYLLCMLHFTPGAHALRATAHYTTRESPRHSTPGTHALRATAHYTPRPQNALRLAGVSRQKITPAVAGAMRMSAKPPLRLPWRGLSPRGRDTPAPLRGRACGSTPKGGRSVTRAEALRAWAPSVPFRGHSRSVTRAEALRAWAPSVTLRKHKRYVPRGTALRA